MKICYLSGSAAQLIGRLEVDANADLAQVRSDIDQLIKVPMFVLPVALLSHT